MALLDPRLLEIEILSEAERKTFAGGPPYEHRREGSVDRAREEALLELVCEQAIVFAESYKRMTEPDPDFPLKLAASRALTKVLDFSESIIPLKITQRGRLRLVRLRDEILIGRDRIRDDFGVLWAARHFEPDLTVHLRSREPGKPISLILVDVDKLRDLNTDIGHPDATKVLIGIFEELHDAIHPHYGYRLGNGDEAGAILVGVPLDEAAKLGEEVRRRIEQRVWPAELKFARRPTVSVGVGTLTEEMDAAAFYKAVDQLTYRAKQTRNTVVEAPIPEPAG